jgi:TnpA family transposase
MKNQISSDSHVKTFIFFLERGNYYALDLEDREEETKKNYSSINDPIVFRHG